jgi:hypothetical protein
MMEVHRLSPRHGSRLWAVRPKPLSRSSDATADHTAHSVVGGTFTHPLDQGEILALASSRFAGATPARLASAAMADFSKTRCDDLL